MDYPYSVIYYGEDGRRVGTDHWKTLPSPEQLPRLVKDKEGEKSKKVREIRVIENRELFNYTKKKGVVEKAPLPSSKLREFLDGIGPQAEEFFGIDPACILTWEPGGEYYSPAIYSYLKNNERSRDITFVRLDGETPPKVDLIRNRKVLIVSDSLISGDSFQAVKEILESSKELGVKGVKIAVYKDFARKADFAVKVESSDKHLKFLLENLDFPKGNK